jgi:hypothetical protein
VLNLLNNVGTILCARNHTIQLANVGKNDGSTWLQAGNAAGRVVEHDNFLTV